MTTADMMQQINFSTWGWDFTTTWTIREGKSYPRLHWQRLLGDIAGPRGVDLVDLALMSQWWGHTDCGSSNNNCDGADVNEDGAVSIEDLVYIYESWLSGT
jgi:hypothetical protein